MERFCKKVFLPWGGGAANKTRGHKYKIVLNECRLDVRKNFYSQRIVKGWNCLPANIVDAKDVITFEKLFDRLYGDSNSNSN